MGLSQQVTELRAQKDRIKSEVAGVAERFAAKVSELNDKITSLGEVDPDLSADVTELGGMADELKNIGTEQTPTEPTEPEPVPTEPTEPSTEEPA